MWVPKQSLIVQWLGYIALTDETRVQFPVGESFLLVNLFKMYLIIILLKMCLSLGGGAQQCEPIVPPTEKAKKQRTILMVCGFVQLALAIMLCFCNVMSGIYELMDVAILFCSLAQMNFCCLTFYMVYITINFFSFVNIIGFCIQTGSIGSVYGTGTTSTTF